jgi:predicted porin
VKNFGKILLASTAAIALCGAAHASDLPVYTKAPPPGPAPAPALVSCTSAVQFIVTDCPLTYYGITVYGTIDVGGGYETHGAPFNSDLHTGVSEFIQKPNRPTAMWLQTPNGLSQSNIGIKGVEQIVPGLNFVFDLNFGFDPYSGNAANGVQSLLDNNGIALAKQSANADSSRAGQWYNGVGYAGFSSPTYGTLTFGRQNSLELDGVNAYDPMGGSYAFSVIGWQGTAVGGGDTEDARISTAIKYRVDVGNNLFRLGAIYQVGGYENNNAAQNEWGAQIGKDFDFGANGKLSVDAIYTENQGAVKAAALSAAQNLAFPGTLAATISDDTSVMLLAKYTYHQLRIYGGYEYNTFANPSSKLTTGFTGIAGIPIAFANITQTSFTINEHLQISWAGVRYAITPTLDAGVAYYHYDQNSFHVGGSCTSAAIASSCSGQLNAASFDIDWQFAKKFDLYGGFMYSAVAGGLANGYQVFNNWAPTVGLRFRF